MVEAYPLYWPVEYPRAQKQKYSRFRTTLGAARDFVKEQVRRLGGTGLVISTNIPTKNNGDLYADWQRYKIDDHGVAVYFTRDGKQVCLCCDTYGNIYENLHAIGRTIEALRQIDRDGVSDFLNRAFTGFTAIPEKAGGPSCWDVLGIAPTKDKDIILNRYKELAKTTHPDGGGTHDGFCSLQDARDLAIQYANQ